METFRDFLEEKKDGPCWPGYVQYGTKMKNGKEVPNCIPEKDVNESKGEYQGKEVTLEKPFRLPAGSDSKFGVYVKNSKGNVVKVKFGDPNMEIKRDDPERRKSFNARHKCDQKNDKTTPGYWSCKAWEPSADWV